MFILFNTESKARNYIKRHSFSRYECAGSCCYDSQNFEIKDNLVVMYSQGSVRDHMYDNVSVVGRIKKRTK